MSVIWTLRETSLLPYDEVIFFLFGKISSSSIICRSISVTLIELAINWKKDWGKIALISFSIVVLIDMWSQQKIIGATILFKNFFMKKWFLLMDLKWNMNNYCMFSGIYFHCYFLREEKNVRSKVYGYVLCSYNPTKCI